MTLTAIMSAIGSLVALKDRVCQRMTAYWTARQILDIIRMRAAKLRLVFGTGKSDVVSNVQKV